MMKRFQMLLLGVFTIMPLLVFAVCRFGEAHYGGTAKVRPTTMELTAPWMVESIAAKHQANTIYISNQSPPKHSPASLRAIEKRVEAQKKKVEACRAELARLVKERGIIYRDGEEPDEAELKRRKENAEIYEKAKKKFEAEQETFNRLRIELLREKAIQKKPEN